jgi:hypothetical protein
MSIVCASAQSSNLNPEELKAIEAAVLIVSGDHHSIPVERHAESSGMIPYRASGMGELTGLVLSVRTGADRVCVATCTRSVRPLRAFFELSAQRN